MLLREERKFSDNKCLIKYTKFVEQEDKESNFLIVGIKQLEGIKYWLFVGISVETYQNMINDEDMESFFNLYIYEVFPFQIVPSELVFG